MFGIKRGRVFLLFFIIACAAACLRIFAIKPTGSIDIGVRFTFYNSEAESRPSKLSIVEVVVQEWRDGEGWINIWELSGRGSLTAMKYGEEPEGLTEREPAKPLSVTGRYRVRARHVPRFGAGGLSIVVFGFDDKGLVVEKYQASARPWVLPAMEFQLNCRSGPVLGWI